MIFNCLNLRPFINHVRQLILYFSRPRSKFIYVQLFSISPTLKKGDKWKSCKIVHLYPNDLNFLVKISPMHLCASDATLTLFLLRPLRHLRQVLTREGKAAKGRCHMWRARIFQSSRKSNFYFFSWTFWNTDRGTPTFHIYSYAKLYFLFIHYEI